MTIAGFNVPRASGPCERFRHGPEARVTVAAVLLAFLYVQMILAAPRVFLLDGKRLEESRQRIQQHDPALQPALDKLKHDADAAMSLGPWSITEKQVTPPSGDKHDYMSQAPYYWPNPDTPNHLPYVRRDGEVNPEYHKIKDADYVRALTEASQTLALAYYFTGDERYADRAALLMRTWFIDPKTRMNPNLNFGQAIPGINTGRGIGIIETHYLVDCIDAIGLLEGSHAWTDADDLAIRDWFSQYMSWLRESPNGKDEAGWKNNHGTMYDVQLATYALFLGKDDIARKVFNAVPEKRYAIQIEPDGRQPLELERTKSWHYSIMNLRGQMYLAILAQHVGVDLWHAKTTDGRGLRAALDFLVPFAMGEKTWAYKEIAGFDPRPCQQLIRRAAQTYSDSNYPKLVETFPAIAPSEIDQLIGVRLSPDREAQSDSRSTSAPRAQ
jgi:hypothetical protein